MDLIIDGATTGIFDSGFAIPEWTKVEGQCQRTTANCAEAQAMRINTAWWAFVALHTADEAAEKVYMDDPAAHIQHRRAEQTATVVVDRFAFGPAADLNTRLDAVRDRLEPCGTYLGRCQTLEAKRLRLVAIFGRRLALGARALDFVANRVVPRLSIIGPLYFRLTGGRYYTPSRAEILGRVAYAGFELLDDRFEEGCLFFAARKTAETRRNETPTFGPLVRLRRVGREGHPIHVYKFRTMHPYSEFLQAYIVRRNGYNDAGKPEGDFRITRWGKLIRALWLDELPQLLNVLKGEMKLFGVRPLSPTRFQELPADIRASRIRHKPGCVPPYVSLNMRDCRGNVEAERIYLQEHERRPASTDWRYLLMAARNIACGRIVSA